MKFLHTADLHLGRALHERSLIEDQRLMLESLVDLLCREEYAALLIAGDVYDRSIPSSEATELLGLFLAALRRRLPDLAVIMSVGNHDSPERLAYGDKLFSSLGIHIFSDPEHSFEPVILEKDGERCAVFALPFLSPGSLKRRSEDGVAGEPLRSQSELAREAASRLDAARTKAMAAGARSALLVAHLFAAGGVESESERSFLGTAERVDASLFDSFSYVALGHLHRYQKAGANAYYSGSPLAYSFGEAAHEKVFLSVEIRGGAEASVTAVPVSPPRKTSRLEGPFASFMEAGSYADKKDDYLEISLTDGRLVENPLAVLRTRFPNLLSVRQDQALSGLGSAAKDRITVQAADGRRNVADDFTAFLAELYEKPDEGEISLFKAIAEETADETA